MKKQLLKIMVIGALLIVISGEAGAMRGQESTEGSPVGHPILPPV
ncbi:hypothetical protein [Mesobacillus foraminis]|nr:hypothetical protein [Mesobacillus foraminis]